MRTVCRVYGPPQLEAPPRLGAEIGDDRAAHVPTSFELVEHLPEFREGGSAADVALDTAIGGHIDELARILDRPNLSRLK